MINGHRIYLVAACDDQGGIGKGGTLPWRLPNELAYFHRVTSDAPEGKQNLVVMGSSTWLSIPEGRRPLPGRKNVVLSRREDFVADGAIVVSSIDDAYAQADETIHDIHVIGGGNVYTQVLSRDDVDGVYLTEVHGSYGCDTFFPEMPAGFTKSVLGSDKENGVAYDYCLYERPS